MSDKIPAPTEGEVLDLLRRHHAKPGNGGSGEYAFLTHVRNRAGFDANREFDAVSLSLWPSRGLHLTVFEVKVSRSDWQRELAKPEKAEDACRLADKFVMVAPRGVIRDGELPLSWGHIEVTAGKVEDGVVTGRKLRTVKAAPWLRDADHRRLPPVDRGFLVSLLRAAGAVPKPADMAPPEHAEIALARSKAYDEGLEAGRAGLDAWRERATNAEQALQTFTNLTGVRLDNGYGINREWSHKRLAEVATALRAVLDGDALVANTKRQLKTHAEHLRAHAARLEEASR